MYVTQGAVAFYSFHIYIHICVCVCVCVCVYIYIYIYTHTHTHTLIGYNIDLKNNLPIDKQNNVVIKLNFYMEFLKPIMKRTYD